MEAAAKAWTDDEFMTLPVDGGKRELLHGEIILSAALVYRSPEAERLLRVTDALDGEDVLSGFRLPLAELFAGLTFE